MFLSLWRLQSVTAQWVDKSSRLNFSLFNLMLSKVLPNFGSLQVHDIMWLAQELLHVLHKSVS